MLIKTHVLPNNQKLWLLDVQTWQCSPKMIRKFKDVPIRQIILFLSHFKIKQSVSPKTLFKQFLKKSNMVWMEKIYIFLCLRFITGTKPIYDKQLVSKVVNNTDVVRFSLRNPGGAKLEKKVLFVDKDSQDHGSPFLKSILVHIFPNKDDHALHHLLVHWQRCVVQYIALHPEMYFLVYCSSRRESSFSFNSHDARKQINIEIPMFSLYRENKSHIVVMLFR